jgi:hypothetical protein
MPDLTIVPANLFPSSKAIAIRGISGEAIVAGDVVAKDPATGLIKKADSNDPTTGAPLAVPIGIATCSTPGANQTIIYVATDAEFTLGATTIPGHPYFLSATPGKICDPADLLTGMKTSLVGFGKLVVGTTSPGNFIVNIVTSGQTI